MLPCRVIRLNVQVQVAGDSVPGTSLRGPTRSHTPCIGILVSVHPPEPGPASFDADGPIALEGWLSPPLGQGPSLD